MPPPLPEELERLASRLALLTSEDGEAENAGRAVGQLARRLGLSGGELKAIFLAGVQATQGGGAAADPDAEAVGRVEGEAAELRRLLDRADGERRAAGARIGALEDENEALRDLLDRARTAVRVARVAALVVAAAGLAGVAAAVFAPAWRLPPGVAAVATAPAPGSALQRIALAGPSGVTLFGQPDRSADPVARLPAGARLPVRRLLWRGFVQWVETEAAGQVAFVPATEVDLR